MSRRIWKLVAGVLGAILVACTLAWILAGAWAMHLIGTGVWGVLFLVFAIMGRTGISSYDRALFK